MERVLEFQMVVPVKPKGQGRPRFGPGGHAYTPASTRAYVNLLRDHAKRAWGDRDLLALPLAVWVEGLFALPKRVKVRNWHTQRPDADNVAKAALDALNGVVFFDDAQVVTLKAEKRWSDKDQLSVFVWSLQQ